jgi:glycosyltransferase involved in cell wall biosynthesis
MNLINSVIDHNVEVTMAGISKNKDQIHPKFNFIPIVKDLKVSNYKFLFSLILKVPFLRISQSSIIHTQRPDMMLPFVLFKRENIKVCTLHGLPANGILLKKGKLIGTVYLLIEKYCLKHTHALIAVSEGTRSEYLKVYPWLKEKICFIPVGFDDNKFRLIDKKKMRKRYKFNNKEKIILYAGRFEKEKGLDFLLESFELVGREKENLQLLSSKLDIDVTFIDPVIQDSLAEIISCSDLFVLSSRYESGPLAVIEALACGVPIVTTDVGRVREFIVTEECGKIVRRDKREFADAIIHFLNCSTEESKNLRRESILNFGFDITAKKTIDLYERLSKCKN